MKITAIGNQFISSDVMITEIQKHFPDSEVVGTDTGWPLNLEHFVNQGEEVSECDGDEDMIAELATDADFLVVDIAPVTKRILAQLPKLQAIAATRGGATNINLAEATRRRIPVFNSPGRNSTSVVEFTIALVFSHLKRISLAHQCMKDGIWRGDLYAFKNAGSEISTMSIGIIGFGAIGRLVAEKFQALGLEVLAYDPFIPTHLIEQTGAKAVSLDELLSESDIVSLHAKVSAENHQMIGQRELELMKPYALLVNTARSELVDMDALYVALSENRIGGAALDVFEVEPLPSENRYRHLDNVTLTPHIGGASLATVNRAVKLAIGALKDWTDGETPAYCMNPEVL